MTTKALFVLIITASMLGAVQGFASDQWQWDSEQSSSRLSGTGLSAAPVVLSSETPSSACDNDETLQWTSSSRWQCVSVSDLPTIAEHSGRISQQDTQIQDNSSELADLRARLLTLERGFESFESGGTGQTECRVCYDYQKDTDCFWDTSYGGEGGWNCSAETYTSCSAYSSGSLARTAMESSSSGRIRIGIQCRQ